MRAWGETGCGALALWACVATTALPAQVKTTTAQALRLAFPGCEIERQTHLLTPAQREAVGKRCDQEFTKAAAFAYVARRGKEVVGTAWFDVHRVRSKKQLLMVAVAADHRVLRVEVLAFAEPPRYRAPKAWLDRLQRRRLGHVRPGRDVPRITGATLTVQATTRCVDRVLALHRVVFGPPPKHEPPKPETPPPPEPQPPKPDHGPPPAGTGKHPAGRTR